MRWIKLLAGDGGVGAARSWPRRGICAAGRPAPNPPARPMAWVPVRGEDYSAATARRAQALLFRRDPNGKKLL